VWQDRTWWRTVVAAAAAGPVNAILTRLGLSDRVRAAVLALEADLVPE
jgi:hypothetical protein